MIINGGYESSTSTDRQAGFVDNLNDNFTVIAEQNGNWLMADAQDVMENIIQAQGGDNIDAVFAVTDDMVQGAMNAITANGLVPGKDVLLLESMEPGLLWSLLRPELSWHPVHALLILDQL